MSFSQPKIELKLSDAKPTESSQEAADKRHLSSSCKIVAHAQIADANFLLILMLTSNENLLVQCEAGASWFTSVSIKKLFPNENCSQLSSLAITTDCSVVICIASVIKQFCAFMDVTWGHKPTLQLSHPTSFSLRGLDSTVYENSQVYAANCFQSSTGHTYLMFGDLSGSLFIVNLNLRCIDVKIDFKSGVRSLHSFSEIADKQLLVSLSDRTQLILPIEGSDFSIRETLIRIVPSQIHHIDKHLCIYPQSNGSVFVTDSSRNQMAFFDSIRSVWSAPPQFCLDHFETGDINQVVCMPRMIVVLNLQNDLFVHLRFFQSSVTPIRYDPAKLTMPSEVSDRILRLIPSTNPNRNGGDSLECFSAVTETGLLTLQTQKPLNYFIIAHLNSRFYSSDCLSAVADSLHVSPSQLCLSLLRHSLRDPSTFDIGQIDGIISLAFKCNVEPSGIRSVLHENNRGDLLLPFLRIRIEKDPGNDSLRQLFLGAILGRIAQIGEDETKGEEQSEEQRRELEADKDALEAELRHFLITFDTDESDVLLFSLRHFLFSCVCVLLCRNATMHSPTVARFFLQLPNWKSIRRVAKLLKCLSFIYWPSVDSFSPTIVEKLFNLVPSFTVVQLKMVNRIAKLLAERSIDSAHSLQIVCLLCLFHLSPKSDEQSSTNYFMKLHQNSLDCGPNCTVLLGEDAYGVLSDSFCDCSSNSVEFVPFFWGEFSAGTVRLVRNEREKAIGGRQCSAFATTNALLLSAKQSGRIAIADDQQSGSVPATKNCWPKRKRRPNPFAFCPTPQAVKLPISDLEFCAVACGTEHVLLLTANGRLFSWGLNRYGQCGNGTEEPIRTPFEIKGHWGRIVNICAGHYHSGFIMEGGELYLWGWGLHGQLGNGGIANLRRPSKSRSFTALGCVKTLCLGYSHTLALCTDGRVFGCGALSYGQLGVDPRDLEGCPTKVVNAIQLPFPVPISLIASKYFHGIALGVDNHLKKNVLFEWGDSPQSLKMKSFLQKRLRLKQKKTKDKNERLQDEANTGTADLPRVHLCIRKLCEWDGGSVKALSAGFNHSALLTTDGELFTWGKSLEMQLGHRNRKEKDRPTKVEAPAKGIQWSEVVCARNFTTAISADGKVFVWGRNDKFQLGLGTTPKKGPSRIRTIALKADKGSGGQQRSVELPADNCVEMATVVQGLRALVEEDGGQTTVSDKQQQLSMMLSNASQLSLNTVSHFLVKHPLPNFTAVQIHLMAGELLAALRLLVSLVEREGLLSESMLSSPLLPSNWSERPVTVIIAQANVTKSPANEDSNRTVALKLKSTFCSSSSPGFPTAVGHLPTHRLELFHAIVDKVWALLRVHPLREVQTCALIELLYHRFPIYNRLAMDLGLCRLVDPFLSILSPPTSVTSPSLGTSVTLRVRLTEIGTRERATHLRQAKVCDLDATLFRALSARCDKVLAQDRWRFFSDCGHFEKYVAESGPARSELAAKRNKQRLCTKCAMSEGRAVGGRRRKNGERTAREGEEADTTEEKR